MEHKTDTQSPSRFVLICGHCCAAFRLAFCSLGTNPWGLWPFCMSFPHAPLRVSTLTISSMLVWGGGSLQGITITHYNALALHTSVPSEHNSTHVP
jgi:hypothetical protein